MTNSQEIQRIEGHLFLKKEHHRDMMHKTQVVTNSAEQMTQSCQQQFAREIKKREGETIGKGE